MSVKYWNIQTCNISDKASIGNDSVIHAHVSIHDDVVIGNRCQIEGGVFIPNGVTLEDDVFVGPGVIFTNDPTLDVQREKWVPTKTLVKKGAKIGAGAMIRAGVVIGSQSIVGMGAVVLNDIPAGEVWAGNPAKFIKKTDLAKYLEQF